MSNLFSKKIAKSCMWCIYGNKSTYNNDVFCLKHGIIYSDSYCSKYKYDPLKREPRRAKPSEGYSSDDFTL